MKKILFAIVAVAALFAVSCNKNIQPDGDRLVTFTASQKYQLDTRATATAFQSGDEIGIFASTPIARYNVKGTVDSDASSVTLDSPIYWQAGQTATTTFAAYFPYISAKTPEEDSSNPMVLPWEVKANQLMLADLDESDLRIAVAPNVAVGDNVSLSFVHAFAKMTIQVNSSAVPGEVDKVEILGTKRSGAVDLVSQTVTVSGDPSAIITNHVSASSPFEAIVLPQTAAPQIRVTMSTGTAYTFTMDGSSVALEAGKVYNIALLIPQGQSQQIPASFSLGSIADWSNDNSSITYQNSDPEVEVPQVWSIIGTINGSNWNIDYPMTRIEAGTEDFQGIWRCVIQGFNYDDYSVHFKLRYGGKWKFEGGYEAGYPEGDGTLGDCLDFQLNGEPNQNGNIYIHPVPFDGRPIQVTFNANNWQISMCQYNE